MEIHGKYCFDTENKAVLGIVELPVSFLQYYSDGYKSYKKVKNSEKL